MSTKSVRLIVALVIVASIVGNSGVAQAGHGAIPGLNGQDLAPLASPVGVQFVHIAIAANITGHITIIDHPLTNGHPEAIFLVTPNWNPGGDAVGIYDNHPIGVYYTSGKWRIFNQDLAAMPVGAAFNVIIPTAAANVFVHTASAGNIDENVSYIDNTLTNGNPNAIIFVTPNYNPGGACPCTYANFPLGVSYEGSNSKWAIFDQNGPSGSMPVNASFNVVVLTAGAGVFVHTATSGNSNSNTTSIDNSLTNSRPNAIVFITPNWNPGGVGGTYDNHNIGVYYSGASSKMKIFNQDIASMPVNAAFNVLVLFPSSDTFVHQATSDNIVGSSTVTSNDLLNGHPNAIAIVTRNWEPGGSGGSFNPHNISLNYTLDSWWVLNQDLEAMEVGATFNVLVPVPGANVFVHKANAGNTTDFYTSIDHPLTNGRPGAIILVTPSYNPGGGSGVYDDHPTGVGYETVSGKWMIFNKDHAVMPVGAAFNVFIPSAGASAFIHTATLGNISTNRTVIDSALTNAHPNALVFSTSIATAGGIIGEYNQSPIGVVFLNSGKWAISNENLSSMQYNWAFNVYVGSSGKIYLPTVMRLP